MIDSLPQLPTECPFLSDEAKQGDPSYTWEDIKTPKLRRYPDSLSALKWQACLGMGTDGVALKAVTADGALVVAKIFRDNAQPPLSAGLTCYWAFKRECRNAAILEIATTSLRHASEEGKPVLINPTPVTRRDGLVNLRQFSADCAIAECPSHFRPISLDTEINPCLGWAVIRGKDANKVLYRQRAVPIFDRDKNYPVIIYRYVPEEKLSEAVVQPQLDFFYRTGFIFCSLEKRNWRGQGILVDFSDAVPPHAREWKKYWFRRVRYDDDEENFYWES